MKNQNDLIFSGVAVLFGVILVIVFWTTAPQVSKPADPATVDTSTPKLPSGDVQYADALPGATNTAGGGSGMGGMMGRMGGRMGGGARAGGAPGGGGGRTPGGPPARAQTMGAGG